MNCLNIGCGAHYHPAWTNIDVAPVSSDVLSWDIKKGLPFTDDSFDVVYHSHVLEHLSPQSASSFLKETMRVLKPNGVTRVVVPDLEQIVRIYLDKLESVCNNARIPSQEKEYDWMVLELFDQMVRNTSGGEMAHYLLTSDADVQDFIFSRIGRDSAGVRNADAGIKSFFSKIRALHVSTIVRLARSRLAAFAVAVIAGKESLMAYREGLFRYSGEIHRWMYDRFSLARKLRAAGFAYIAECKADESRISGFGRYGLDINEGTIRKPDSLFMEAVKPAEPRQQ